MICRNYSFQKTNTILICKQWARCCSLSPTWVSLERHMCFFNLSERDYWQLKDPFCTLKSIIFRKNFQKHTQFPKGNNVRDDPVSNRDAFLFETHVFRHLGWMCLFGTKWFLLHVENHVFQDISLSKPYSILQGKACAGCFSLSYRRYCLVR